LPKFTLLTLEAVAKREKAVSMSRHRIRCNASLLLGGVPLSALSSIPIVTRLVLLAPAESSLCSWNPLNEPIVCVLELPRSVDALNSPVNDYGTK